MEHTRKLAALSAWTGLEPNAIVEIALQQVVHSLHDEGMTPIEIDLRRAVMSHLGAIAPVVRGWIGDTCPRFAPADAPDRDSPIWNGLFQKHVSDLRLQHLLWDDQGLVARIGFVLVAGSLAFGQMARHACRIDVRLGAPKDVELLASGLEVRPASFQVASTERLPVERRTTDHDLMPPEAL